MYMCAFPALIHTICQPSHRFDVLSTNQSLSDPKKRFFTVVLLAYVTAAEVARMYAATIAVLRSPLSIRCADALELTSHMRAIAENLRIGHPCVSL